MFLTLGIFHFQCLVFLVFHVSFQTTDEDPSGLRCFERLLYQLFTTQSKKIANLIYFDIVIMIKFLYDIVNLICCSYYITLSITTT